MIANYIFRVCTWHILHGMHWALNDEEIDALLKATENLMPMALKHKRRRPYTIDFICTIWDQLNLQSPLDSAVYSCLTTAFYCTARLGKFTVPTLTSFNPDLHIKHSDMRVKHDRNNFEMKVFHLPQTKTSSTEGEDISFAKQNGLSDPESTFLHHLEVNDPPPGIALFAYHHKNGHRSLTKQKFIS
jgi:hypothetical protein